MHRAARRTALSLLAILIITATGCQTIVVKKEVGGGRDGVFIHLTHGVEDPHAVLMALRMANLMAKDHDVLVYVDLRGVQVVMKDAPDLNMQPFDSSQTQIQALLDADVPIHVCPGCLRAAGKTPGDIMRGVRVAEKEAFFGFTKGRILTLDY